MNLHENILRIKEMMGLEEVIKPVVELICGESINLSQRVSAACCVVMLALLGSKKDNRILAMD